VPRRTVSTVHTGRQQEKTRLLLLPLGRPGFCRYHERRRLGRRLRCVASGGRTDALFTLLLHCRALLLDGLCANDRTSQRLSVGREKRRGYLLSPQEAEGPPRPPPLPGLLPALRAESLIHKVSAFSTSSRSTDAQPGT